uniref:O-GlcNAc transferase C-terminal domain-containing protein n=1 Tax=Palpitomonas bilix TaxID=652834 RepID=A0A7S3CWG9_9EUKA|mmetsp:Transcript_11966/g.32405  ORF Transcript_11966/g.32405 Transcript_11966/m.32405 type:complete len:604 (+) Transcript_11966:240-2051(+)
MTDLRCEPSFLSYIPTSLVVRILLFAAAVVYAQGEAERHEAGQTQAAAESDLEKFTFLLAENPRSAVLHYNRGVALVNLGRYDDAMVELETANEIEKDDERTLLAIAHLSNLAKLSSTDNSDLSRLPHADHRTFAVAANRYLSVGCAQRAKQAFAAALRLSPLDVELLHSSSSSIIRHERFSLTHLKFAKGLLLRAARRAREGGVGGKWAGALSELFSILDSQREAVAVSMMQLEDVHTMNSDEERVSSLCSLLMAAQKGSVWHVLTGGGWSEIKWRLFDLRQLPLPMAISCPLPLQSLSLPFKLSFTKHIAQLHANKAMSAAPKLYSPLSAWLTTLPSVRIGYLTAETSDRQVGRDLAVLFEHHSSAFVVHCFDLSGRKKAASSTRDKAWNRRVEKACNTYMDVSHLTIEEGAKTVNAAELSLLVYVDGWTLSPFANDMLALRPAPLQLGFKGFASTSGGEYINGILGDAIATPPEYAHAFSEPSLLLHGSTYHMVGHDDVYGFDLNALSGSSAHHVQWCSQKRAQEKKALGAGSGPLLVSFNNQYKVDEGVFALWMEGMRRTAKEKTQLGMLKWDKTGAADVKMVTTLLSFPGSLLCVLVS